MVYRPFGLPTICILKKLYNTFKIGKIALEFGHCQKILTALQLLHFFHTSDLEEELFLTQSSFNGSSNRGNELEEFVSSSNRQVDHENAQLNVEEATEELFSFDHSDEHQKLSIGSVEKETKRKQEESVEEGYHGRG